VVQQRTVAGEGTCCRRWLRGGIGVAGVTAMTTLAEAESTTAAVGMVAEVKATEPFDGAHQGQLFS
jgi:hypothetical protein